MTSFDMSDTITARSDQINFDDFLSGSKVVTIAAVRKGSAEQPVDFDLVELPGKAYRPSKSMRRVMVFAWGKDASAYIGKRLELYGDPDVKFGSQKVGGIKIAKMSGIDKGFTINLTATRGKKDPHRVEPLPDAPARTEKPLEERITAVVDAFAAMGVTLQQLEAKVNAPREKWSNVTTLTNLGKAIKDGKTTVAEEFEQGATTGETA